MGVAKGSSCGEWLLAIMSCCASLDSVLSLELVGDSLSQAAMKEPPKAGCT